MAYTNELVAECLQNEQAFCTAACPFNLDVRDFIGKLQQGRFNVAYKTYQNTVGFPGIVSSLCDEPCKNVCALKDAGGSISIRMLERASMDFARNTEPDQYNMPLKDKSIAIVGGGISGLACALRLATKKYAVTVFERSSHTGGHLHELMKPEEFMADIEKQFMNEKYTIALNTEITGLDDIAFDAIYIATGKDGNDFGLLRSNEGPYASNRDGIFMGGSLNGSGTMKAIADGLNAATAIEMYLKTSSMSHPDTTFTTKLTYDAIRIKESVAVTPADGTAFSKEEALAEAKRCLKCTCNACVYYSPLLDYFKKFPRRITEEVEVTIHPATLDGNGTVATRLISTCNHCGLCKEVCPKDIDTGEFLLRSHRAMHEKGAMPWAFHEFYLRDMLFSNNEASLVKTAPGFEKSRFMFFPGCQLGASNPEYVTKSYKHLLDQLPDTSLMLGCCGAPAEWAGDEALHASVIDKIRSDWMTMGQPTVILTCPTCNMMFRRYLPEIQCKFLYDFIDIDKLQVSGSFKEIKASVFDPCASRHEPELQRAIRSVATKAGFSLEPLPMEGKMAECCSYGGQVAIAHPPFATHSVQKRISQNNNPYITYCSNCRDIFASAGKEVWHILDIIFDIKNKNRKEPTVSERRDNRLLLKEQMLRDIWKEETAMGNTSKKLLVSPQLSEKLNKAMILESDLAAVIDHCEETGEKMLDPEKDTYSGHMRIENMTYWVEYQITGQQEYELINGYCHRMKIEEA
jgi:Fe-S oxidoreductase